MSKTPLRGEQEARGPCFQSRREDQLGKIHLEFMCQHINGMKAPRLAESPRGQWKSEDNQGWRPAALWHGGCVEQWNMTALGNRTLVSGALCS